MTLDRASASCQSCTLAPSSKNAMLTSSWVEGCLRKMLCRFCLCSSWPSGILREIGLNRLLGSQQLLYPHPNEADLLPLGVFAGIEEGLHQPVDLNLQLLQLGSRILARV